jgi:hypothetical protein
MSEREVLTWELYGTASRELAQQVADSGFVPTIVLDIARDVSAMLPPFLVRADRGVVDG